VVTAAAPARLMHLMTIEMGAWCGASGPGNGRASSAWREVTCTECLAKRTDWLLALVWDMLQAMPASHEALGFAVRAGRLGVRDEQDRPLAMACLPGDPFGASAFHSHAPGCGCPLCEGAIADAADEARRDEREDGE
jgi:hypothetical protein